MSNNALPLRLALVVVLVNILITATQTDVAAAPLVTYADFSSQANFSWTSPESDPSGEVGIYLPGGPVGNVTLAGVNFNIVTNSSGKTAWNSYRAAAGGSGTVTLTIPVSVYGVTDVYTLINTYWGTSSTLAYLLFTGSSGTTFTKYLAGRDDIRDWCCGGGINNSTTINVYNIAHSGLNGLPAWMDMQHVVLPAAFATQYLTQVELVDFGNTNVQRSILGGMTVLSTDQIPTPEPTSLSLLVACVSALGFWSIRSRRGQTATH